MLIFLCLFNHILQKYLNFHALRDHFNKLATEKAKKQIRQQKGTPRGQPPHPGKTCLSNNFLMFFDVQFLFLYYCFLTECIIFQRLTHQI